MNRNVYAILPLKELVQMKDKSQTQLLTIRQFSKHNLLRKENLETDSYSTPKSKTEKQKQSSSVRVARRIVIPAGQQVWVSVTSSSIGPCIFEPNMEIFQKHRLSTHNGIFNVRQNIPFQLLVSTFGRDDVQLPKGMSIAHTCAVDEVLIRGVNTK